MSPADIRRWAYSELVQCKPQYSERLNALADVVEKGDYLWGFAGSPMSIEFAQARDDFKVALARVEALQP